MLSATFSVGLAQRNDGRDARTNAFEGMFVPGYDDDDDDDDVDDIDDIRLLMFGSQKNLGICRTPSA